ncbi:MAG: hypothetical protein J6568_06060 [Snodgrassella sp.]|nr:hypothetical protein [Snodgrassella sp.]
MTGLFHIIIFCCFALANSEELLKRINFPDVDDPKIILVILTISSFFACIPALLAALSSCYFTNHLLRDCISIVALLCAVLEGLFFIWLLNWIVILANILATALNAWCFVWPKPQTPEH